MATTAQTTTNELQTRILDEGYGPGAWHGPDLKAALADVPSTLAFWRPAAGRHNIAEIVLHHAYSARGVRGRLTGRDPEAFVLDGDDWFAVEEDAPLTWRKIQEVLEAEQQRLADAVAAKSTLPDAERFGLVLGITCHAVYHAGQVQLIKKLANS